MTPQQLLAVAPVRVTTALKPLWGIAYAHVPEVPLGANPRSVTAPSVVVRWYKEHRFDRRRIWRLGSVHVRDLPVMIVRNAGREGDDHASRYVFDEYLYSELLERLGRRPDDRRTGYPKTRAGWSWSGEETGETLPPNRADDFFGRNLDSPAEAWLPY